MSAETESISAKPESISVDPETIAAELTGLFVLRFMHRGETLRNGRVLTRSWSSSDPVPGSLLLEMLSSEEANLPMHRLVAFYYSKALEGWQRLNAHSRCPLPAACGGSPPRIEVMLEPLAATSHEAMASASQTARGSVPLSSYAVAAVGDDLSATTLEAAAAAGGFFAIGVYNSKSAENVGTLWRSAFMLGAAYIFTVGSRNAWEKAADTYKAWRRLPAFRYADWAAFACAAPYSTTWAGLPSSRAKRAGSSARG
mmetsp:Transcript_38029/g.126005  ORF Transcript_38029/g.126005 Transcript_38029/m.126005 type:complete len:256 (+) Transcript_38029:56-823(+)